MADIFTKALPRIKFEIFRAELRVSDFSDQGEDVEEKVISKVIPLSSIKEVVRSSGITHKLEWQ